MSTSKHFDKLVAVVLVLGLLLTVAFINGEALGIEKIVDEDAEQYETSSLFTANDRNGDWDTSKATATITLNGESAKISGNGAYFNDGSVVITGAGYYVFSGALTDGSIVVDAYDSSKVFLLLNGVELYCADDACLRVENAEKVFLTLAAGTENRFESGADYSETALADNTGGTIFTHDDLTINGSGSLEIVANYKHGVDANDDLILAGGTISVTCPADGLHVNDSFRMTDTSLTIDAGDDGIHSDTDIYIESGTLLITNCYEGLEAKRIEVAGGDIMIYPTDDGFNANGGSGGFGNFGGDGGGERPDFGGEMPDFDGEMPDFDGERPDSGSERPDFSSMFENGEMPTPPDFDGELPDMGEMPDMGGEAADGETSDGEDEETYIRISGGSIMIINETAQDADGLDSNGDIYITGGTILVSLPGSGTNNAIDFGSESGGVAEISGGTVIACGASMMAESFDTSSTQASILYNTSAGASAGTTVALEDADGNTLLSWDVPCSFTSMVMSCPEMKLGETYTVVIGDSAAEITLDEISASYGDAQSGGFGGSMNWGGMSPRGGFPGGGFPGGGGRGDSSGEDTENSSGRHGGKGGFPGGGRFPGQRSDASESSDTGETATQTQ